MTTRTSMTTRNSTTIADRSPRWLPAALLGLLLSGLWVLGATAVQAQVQIDQVADVTSQIEGATQGQIVVTLPRENCEPAGASCEGVSRTEVLDLIPGDTPPLQGSGLGNSAVIVQRGDDNDATVDQQGSSNEASITQLNGDENEATVVQEPGDGVPGQNNLAVIVQNGSFNQTTIQQSGKNNRAGIKLVGDNNGIELEQTGDGHEYLLDFTGSGLGSSSSTHQVSQTGSDNRLVQLGEGRMPFNVQQRGDGMRMVIRHSGGQ